MTFKTYENPRYVMIHHGDCGQLNRVVSPASLTGHPNLEAAQEYARRSASKRPEGWCHCQVCMPGTLPRHPWMDERDESSPVEHGARGAGRSQTPLDRAFVALVQSALGIYEKEVEESDLERNTKDTYIRHARSFVRWLDGDFTPGATLGDRPNQ